MMAESHQIWQGTVWTGLTNQDGERLCPEVLPWADPYIAALVDKHRWQAVLFAMQPDTDDDEAFWDDESFDDAIPPLPDAFQEETNEAVRQGLGAWSGLAPNPADEPTEEYTRESLAWYEVMQPSVSYRRSQGDLK